MAPYCGAVNVCPHTVEATINIDAGFRVHRTHFTRCLYYQRSESMDLNPLPPLTPTLNLGLQPKNPSDLPPEPSLSMLFPENMPYRLPDNPFRGSISEGLSETHKIALQDALASVRDPLLFNPVNPYAFNGVCVGVDNPSDNFNSAVTMVTAAIERGYCSNRDLAPLGTSDWARLSCALLAAVG